jgi:threonine dehydrogenase-like Zn-dependent dehydrogenase
MTARRTVKILETEPPSEPLPPGHVEGVTLASIISPGTELNWYYDPAADPPGGYPAVPGYTAVFRIDDVSPDVEELGIGDVALAFYGSHSSHQRHLAERVVRVPDALSPLVAPFARMMAISMATLSTTRARPPGPIGVSGLGIVGHLAAKVFHAAGYEVLAWGEGQERQALLAATGLAVQTEAPRRRGMADDDPDGSGELQLVLECSGREDAVVDACAAVRRGGEVVMVGLPWRQRSEVPAHALLRTIFHRYVELRSGWEYAIPDQALPFTVGSGVENMAGAMRWLMEGRVDVEGLATVVVVADAPAAYAGLSERTWPTLSAVFDWTA